MFRYYIIYKPYQVLSQFTSSIGKQTLADFFDLPKDVYAVGRLDFDSEGLLLLTNDPKINHQLLNPDHKHEREYLVQVEGDISASALQELINGPEISIDGKSYKTKKCKCAILQDEPTLPARNPPIRFRKEIPTSWISMTLHEGKNRQVRKMTAKVGFPTLRLVRYRIGNITIESMQAGDMKEWKQQDFYNALFG